MLDILGRNIPAILPLCPKLDCRNPFWSVHRIAKNFVLKTFPYGIHYESLEKFSEIAVPSGEGCEVEGILFTRLPPQVVLWSAEYEFLSNVK